MFASILEWNLWKSYEHWGFRWMKSVENTWAFVILCHLVDDRFLSSLIDANFPYLIGHRSLTNKLIKKIFNFSRMLQFELNLCQARQNFVHYIANYFHVYSSSADGCHEPSCVTEYFVYPISRHKFSLFSRKNLNS